MIAQVEKAKKDTPLQFFIPNEAQERLIHDVGNFENYIVVAAFANGVGKSACVFAILGAIMWGAPTDVFNYPLFTKYPATWPKFIRIVTEPALVNEMGPVQVESSKWWPRGRYQWFKGGKQYFSQFFTDTGFAGEVMTTEQAVKEFEGKTVGPTVFIEPPPREIVYACFARQRMGAINILDMTPLTNAAWVMDELIDKPEVLIDGQIVGRVKCINADIEKNCKQHGKNGQLEHNNILQIVSRYDPDEIEARAHGQFMHLSGRIFKGFDRGVHVVERPMPQVKTIYQVVDPAIGKPLAVIWAWVDEIGSVHVFDEWPEGQFEGARDSNLTVSDYAELFKVREAGNRPGWRILDRHFGNARRTLGGLTLKQEFAEAGLDFADSYNVEEEVETGILKVKEYLKYDKSKPLDSLNRPRLTISPKCHNTILALDRWSRDPKTGKPREDWKDFCDVVRYLVMSNPVHETPRQYGETRMPYYGVGG